uniref:C3H1-type domain-containing protein n=1 Tax=Syphacia muris TaxID=451379 RepID=A0A0N5AHN8_9BILA
MVGVKQGPASLGRSKDRLDNLVQRFRSATGRLSSIIVTEINKNNYERLWPLMMISIKEASFISIDLELSGLGNFRGKKDINERYSAIRETARTYSVVSLGISAFKFIKRKETRMKKRIKFKCQVFNLLTFCMDPFVVEPSSLQFLVGNKFDLNRLVKEGVSYGLLPNAQGNSLSLLWESILEQDIPLVFHNGFVDLAFLYQHFYEDLPENLSEFITNISDWFSGQRGCLYDSKYFAEYCIRMKASFLEYVFRKCQRDNAVEASYLRLYVSIEFDDSVSKVFSLMNATEIVDCRLPEGFYEADIKINFPSKEERKDICSKYASYGFCNSREDCPLLHNVDAVLDNEAMKQSKIRMRRRRRYEFYSNTDQMEERTEHLSGTSDNEQSDDFKSEELSCDEGWHYNNKPYLKRSEIGCHRAGVDSFMTGFSLIYMSRMALLRTGKFDAECANKLPIPGKTIPLIIRKYEHVQKTAEHLERWKPIQSERDKKVY